MAVKENKQKNIGIISTEMEENTQAAGSFRAWVSRHPIVLMLIPVVLVAGIYSNTLHVSFQFDDIMNIRDNPHIRITEISPRSLMEAGFKSLAFHRPVANISFALNYYVHAFDLAGYHIINIFIHILTGIVLFILFRDTLELVRRKKLSPLVREPASSTPRTLRP